MTNPPRSRAADLAALASRPFDVLVIGGGITGAGVARDAAMRGLRVALVEREDFASGTSSRSSRLVHGGVRYLEHGQVALVFESSRERRTLLRIAPHLVRPLAFVWPVYRGARISRLKLALALTLYDALSLFRNVQRHARLSAADVMRHEPHLDPRGLLGGARYWDAATDDSRLTLATALSAREAGAVVVNHAEVVDLLRDESGRITGARVRDEAGGVLEVRARVTVNATGPWSDQVEAMAVPGAMAGVRGSKGVHICVPRARVGNTAAVTLTAPQDGRVMFVLPAGDFTIVGTTDTFDAVSPDEVRASEADIEYLLTAANHFFPDARLDRAEVVSAWAGIRPLAALPTDDGGPGSASREHAITRTAPGFLRVTGGKLTTYRAMASEVVDAVQATLGTAATASSTAEHALAGGELEDVAAAIAEAAVTTGDAAVAERLVHAHGSRWRSVWALAGGDLSLRERIVPGRPYLLAELRYAVEQEMALTLGDLLVRRTPVAFETLDHGLAAAAHVAPRVAAWAGWDAEATRRALTTFASDAARIFGEPGPPSRLPD